MVSIRCICEPAAAGRGVRRPRARISAAHVGRSSACACYRTAIYDSEPSAAAGRRACGAASAAACSTSPRTRARVANIAAAGVVSRVHLHRAAAAAVVSGTAAQPACAGAPSCGRPCCGNLCGRSNLRRHAYARAQPETRSKGRQHLKRGHSRSCSRCHHDLRARSWHLLVAPDQVCLQPAHLFDMEQWPEACQCVQTCASALRSTCDPFDDLFQRQASKIIKWLGEMSCASSCCREY